MKGKPIDLFFDNNMKFAMSLSFLTMIIGGAVWLTLNYADFEYLQTDAIEAKEEREIMRQDIADNRRNGEQTSARVTVMEKNMGTMQVDIRAIRDAVIKK